jgi:K+ transporter
MSALITASFSLYQQLISFRCAPPLRITQTSEHHQGQVCSRWVTVRPALADLAHEVYIPKLNWLLAAGTIALSAYCRFSRAHD